MSHAAGMRSMTPPACGHLPTSWGGKTFAAGLPVLTDGAPQAAARFLVSSTMRSAVRPASSCRWSNSVRKVPTP
jgi:hypothetical protein